MQRSTFNLRGLTFLACGFAAFLGACSNNDSSSAVTTILAESEPNELTTEALALTLDRPAGGTVTTIGDADLWKIALATDEVVRIELRGARLDQGTWDAADNIPRLTVLDTDGTTQLLDHNSSGWSWGFHDLDIPMFRAPADGTYYIQVAQDDDTLAGGAYALTVSLVDVGTMQAEVEPAGVTGVNDTGATAEAITPGIVRGFHVDDESDFYSFTITEPTVIDFDLTAYRNGIFGGDDEYFDTWLALYDTDGTTQIDSTDDTYFYDSAIHHLITTPGTYFIEVQECCGLGDAGYFLTFATASMAAPTAETEANDTFGTAEAVAYGAFWTGAMDTGEEDFFSFSGTAGDIVHLEKYDSNFGQGYADEVVMEILDTDGVTPLSTDSGGVFDTTRTILTSTGTFYVHVTPDGTPAATDYAFRVKRNRAATFETEPNDDLASSGTFPAGGAAAGLIDVNGDIDMYQFTATANHLVNFSMYSSSGWLSDGFFDLSGNGSTLDPVVTIRNTAGDILAKCSADVTSVSAESVTEGLATMSVSFVVPVSGTYTVDVTDATGTSAATHTWVLVKH